MQAKLLSLTLFLFVGIFSQLTAQAVSVGFSGGPSYSLLIFDRDQSNHPDNAALGFVAGADFTLHFNEHFGLRSGFNFERKAGEDKVIFTDENGFPFSEITRREMFDYLTFPIVLQASYGQKTKAIFQLGLSTGLLVRQTVYHKDLPPGHGDEKFRRTDDFHRIESTLISGLGVETEIYKNVSFQFLLRPSYGLTNLNKDSFSFPFSDIRTFTLAGTVGLQFHLN